jgi:hypothetical protein
MECFKLGQSAYSVLSSSHSTTSSTQNYQQTGYSETKILDLETPSPKPVIAQ